MAKNTDTTKDNKATEQSDESTPTEGRNFQVHIPPDLEYHYRDVANVFVGSG